MVIIEKKRIQNIPMLHLVEQTNMDKKLPLIMFVHGYTSAKENNLHYGYLLAEQGFRVILPEALYHGERSEGLSEQEMNYRFWDIVVNEIHELEIIKNEFVSQNLVKEDAIGVAGTSMGGITTLGALTQYPWITAAVSLMGSPYYEQFCRGQIAELQRLDVDIPFTEEQLEETYAHLRKFDLSVQPEKLQNRPLLFWHGEKDDVVPFHYTYDFYKSLLPLYKGSEEKLAFIVDSVAGHIVSREGILATVEWFKKHLQ
ncbi:esterase [Bacillus timonensis]|nr:esterase [Bacillus timonensis]